MKNSNWTSADIPSQHGKLFLITGANSGLGLEAAKVLTAKGAAVVMAVRDLEKGKNAVDQIRKEIPGSNPALMHLDLADLDAIRSFSEEFHSRYDRLNVLMNNAGVMWPKKRMATKQDFEIQFGTNHLGHFLLTGLLLDLLKKTQGARVVNQSSIAHRMMADIHFDDLNWKQSYDKIKAYAQSKLANLLFTYELDRRFKAHGIPAIAVASHPGVSSTNLFRYSGAMVNLFNNYFAQKAWMGALPILRAATEESLKGSEFIGPTGMMGVRGYPRLVRSTAKSHDVELARRLWTVSEKLTGISYDF